MGVAREDLENTTEEIGSNLPHGLNVVTRTEYRMLAQENV